MAPSSRQKVKAKRDVVLSPQERAAMDSRWAEYREKAEDLKLQRDRIAKRMGELNAAERASYCSTTMEAGEAMTHNQALFLGSWDTNIQAHPRKPPLKLFREVFEAYRDTLHNFSLDDVYDLSFILRNKGGVGCAKKGRQIVNLCAEMGHAEAVIQVVASALRQDVTKPGIMRSRPIMMALDRLRAVAKTGNLRAMVMEANVARHTNQSRRAITLYEQALDLIREDDGTRPGDKYSRIRDELSSPWIELGFLHHTLGENVAAMKAYMVGQEQDDPMAYFNLARLDFFMSGQQYTNDWLYNMTKAGASGHYKAAYELGLYYASTPAPPSPPQASFLEKLSGFGAFLWKSNINLNPKANIEHHNAFANEPKLRIKLAQQWLKVARNNHYLYANIALAELSLQKYIYPKGTLSKPLDPYGHSTDPTAIENPLFKPQEAQVMLTEVLTACLQISEAKSVSTTNAEYRHMARPWSFHVEVLEEVESSEILKDLKEQAEMIADAAGIDIYSTTGLAEHVPHLGVLRFHKGTRGEGLCERTPSTEDKDEKEAAKPVE
ncbi:hypothetical protein KCU85_g1105, partial [Aureobasidium melanogenum]